MMAGGMQFQCNEDDICRMVMGYLKERRLFETLTSFQLETGVTEDSSVGKDLAFLQRLILEGRWEDLVLFVQPFRGIISDYEEIELIILRQQFLEALSWQGGGGHRHALLPWKPAVDGNSEGDLDVDALATMLSSLERLCPPKEFNALCLCLTLERLCDHADYQYWSVSEGRVECYEKIRAILEPLFVSGAVGKRNRLEEGGAFTSIVAMGLAYQVMQTTGTRPLMPTGATLNDGILMADGVDGRALIAPSLELFNPVGNRLYPRAAPSSSASKAAPASSSAAAAPAVAVRPLSDESRKSSPRYADRPSPASVPATALPVQFPAVTSNPSSPARAPVSWNITIGGGGSEEIKTGFKERPKALRAADPSPSKATSAAASRPPVRSPKAATPIQQPRRSPSKADSAPTGTVLYTADCPLRCILAVEGGRKDEGLLVVGSNDRSVKVLAYTDTAVDVVKGFKEVHRGSVYAMDWLRGDGDDDDGLVATGSNDKSIRLINIQSGVVSGPMKGHTGTIRSVAFQPRDALSALLASAGAGDNRPHLWDVSAGVGAAHSLLTAHDDTVHGLAWVHDLLLSGCERGKLIAHDLRSPTPAWTLDLAQHPLLKAANAGGICCLAAAGAGQQVVAGCMAGFVCVVDGRSRTVEAVHRAHTDDVRSIATAARWARSSSGSGGVFGLVTTSFDGNAALWDVDSSMSASSSVFASRGALQGHTDKVLGVCLVPTPRRDRASATGEAVRIATSGADGRVILWDPPTSYR